MSVTSRFSISVNGGAPQYGGIDVPSAATVQLTPDSTVGWLRVRWEIYDYPEGWATPAGWTLDATTGVVYSTAFTPSLITMPDNGALWGKWGVRCKVNEQLDTDQSIIAGLLYTSNYVSMLSPSGLRDTGALETTQFCTPVTLIKAWLRDYQRNLRAIERPSITVATTDATPTRLRRYPVADNTLILIRAIVKVQSADVAHYGEYEVKAAYKRVAGTLSQVYAPIVTMIVESDAGLNVQLALNGSTDVDLQAVGLVATSLTWTANEMYL